MRIALAGCVVSLILWGCGGTTHRSSVSTHVDAPIAKTCEGPDSALVTGGGHAACVKWRDSRNLAHEAGRLQASWCPKERCRVRVDLSQTFRP